MKESDKNNFKKMFKGAESYYSIIENHNLWDLDVGDLYRLQYAATATWCKLLKDYCERKFIAGTIEYYVDKYGLENLDEGSLLNLKMAVTFFKIFKCVTEIYSD